MSRILRQWPLHTFVAAVYPVLALLAINISQVKASAALRPLVIAVCAAALLWGLLFLFLRDSRRAALLTSWWLVLFFLYGHLYNYLEANTSLGRHRLLLPVWIILAFGGSWWILRKIKDLVYPTQVLNGICLLLLIFPLVQLGAYSLRSGEVGRAAEGWLPEISALQLPPGQPPDVYYIILDAYARNDVLKSVFAYNNTAFTSWLEQKGFYLAFCSQSNYSQTELSLASSLNLAYLEDLIPGLSADRQDRLPLRELLHANAVRGAFQRLGYTFVAFETGFLFSQFEDADVYLSSSPLGGMSGFEVLLIKTSAGLVLVDAAAKLPSLLVAGLAAPERRRYTQVRYTLDQLAEIPTSIPGPKFVFAHILAPHGPLVFSSDGSQVHYPEPVDDATYTRGYRDELAYLNQRLVGILARILSDSAVPPIIILQADHGHDYASADDRMAILNVYYLPGDGSDLLYPAITPVNTFRLIFDHYFGGSFDLVKDRSFFSYYQTPFEFKYIPNLCK